MVQVLGLRLWGEIRIPQVLGSNTQTSSLYPKQRLTDLGLEVFQIQDYEPYPNGLSMSAVTHKVLNLVVEDRRSAKYIPRS